MPQRDSYSQHVNTARLSFTVQRDVRWPCRCRYENCQRRATLRKHPSHYTRPVKCPACQRKDAMLVDWYRLAKEWHVKPCRCYGYSFPHVRGRGYCDHNPRITSEDLKERAEQRRWA